MNQQSAQHDHMFPEVNFVWIFSNEGVSKREKRQLHASKKKIAERLLDKVAFQKTKIATYKNSNFSKALVV
jgi:hypothetical protein